MSNQLATTRAPAPVSKPGAQIREAIRNGQCRLPPHNSSTSRANGSRTVVHAMVNSNCNAFSTRQPKPLNAPKRMDVDVADMEDPQERRK